jgi:hypothetical protein
VLGRIPDVVISSVKETIRRPTFPLLLVAIMIVFLLLQDRIDRRDPKLAGAPVGVEPDLTFGPAIVWR